MQTGHANLQLAMQTWKTRRKSGNRDAILQSAMSICKTPWEFATGDANLQFGAQIWNKPRKFANRDATLENAVQFGYLFGIRAVRQPRRELLYGVRLQSEKQMAGIPRLPRGCAGTRLRKAMSMDEAERSSADAPGSTRIPAPRCEWLPRKQFLSDIHLSALKPIKDSFQPAALADFVRQRSDA